MSIFPPRTPGLTTGLRLDVDEPERTRLYKKMVEMLPDFDDYRRRTERVIPVIVLTPEK